MCSLDDSRLLDQIGDLLCVSVWMGDPTLPYDIILRSFLSAHNQQDGNLEVPEIARKRGRVVGYYSLDTAFQGRCKNQATTVVTASNLLLPALYLPMVNY